MNITTNFNSDISKDIKVNATKFNLSKLNNSYQTNFLKLKDKIDKQTEKQIITKKNTYAKILNNEPLFIKDIASLLNCSTKHIRQLEFKGIIPKPSKEERDDIEDLQRRRIWNLEDLHAFLESILQYNWIRYHFDRTEIETIYNYVHSLYEVKYITQERKQTGFFGMRPQE